MDVQITIRRGRAGESFKALAEEKARKLGKYDPRIIRVELLFDEDGGTVRAEARAFVAAAVLAVVMVLDCRLHTRSVCDVDPIRKVTMNKVELGAVVCRLPVVE